jgi:hypothetical protein
MSWEAGSVLVIIRPPRSVKIITVPEHRQNPFLIPKKVFISSFSLVILRQKRRRKRRRNQRGGEEIPPARNPRQIPKTLL